MTNILLLPIVAVEAATSQDGDIALQIGFQSGSPASPIDLSGIVFGLKWRRTAGDKSVIFNAAAENALVNAGTSGVVQLAASQARAARIPVGSYVADLVATADGHTIVVGTWSIAHAAGGPCQILSLSTTQRNNATAVVIGYVPGPQGKSAYEVAQGAGFVGTITAWLASLKGEKGDIGPSVTSMASSAISDATTFGRAWLTAASVAAQRALLALSVSDVLGAAPLASPTFTGAPAAPTPAGGTNSQQIATTAFVKDAIDTLKNNAPGALDTLGEIAAQLANDESAVAALTTSVAAKAPSTRQVATGGLATGGGDLSADRTITVQKASGAEAAAGTVDSKAVTPLALATPLATKAPLDSPTFTGAPAAPTPTIGDNSTKLATTAFVSSAVAAAPTGTSLTYKAKSAAYTLVAGDTGADIRLTGTLGTNYAITLPASSALSVGWRVRLKNAGSNKISITPQGADTCEVTVLYKEQDCFIEYAGGGAFVTFWNQRLPIISRTVVTAAASVDIPIPDGYGAFRWSWENFKLSANDYLAMRVSQAAAFMVGATDYFNIHGYAGPATGGSAATSANSYWLIGVNGGDSDTMGNASGAGNNVIRPRYFGRLQVGTPGQTPSMPPGVFWEKSYHSNGGNFYMGRGWGNMSADPATRIDAMRFFMVNGATLTGAVTLTADAE